MRHLIEFKNPLTIDVNVTVTQKQDERVAQLEKELADVMSEAQKNADSLNADATKLSEAIK